MKFLKKSLFILVLLINVFTLVSCGSETKSEGDSKPTLTEEQHKEKTKTKVVNTR